MIVTFNTCDFPPGALVAHGIEALHPDEFVCRLVAGHPAAVRKVVTDYRTKLRKPPKTADEYLCSVTSSAAG